MTIGYAMVTTVLFSRYGTDWLAFLDNAFGGADGGIDQMNALSDFPLNNFFQKGVMSTAQNEGIDLAGFEGL